MKISTLRVLDTSFLHLRDADEQLLYEADEQGNPDKTKPVGITLYGPGSGAYAKANQARQNKILDTMKKRGKTETTPDEALEENAEFLAAVTAELHHLEPEDGSTGRAAAKAIYTDRQAGHVVDQAAKHIASWGNFKKASPAS